MSTHPRALTVLIAAAVLVWGANSAAISAESGVKAGLLRCDVAGNLSFIFGSSRDVTCTYRPQAGKRIDRYTGEIKKFGVDIGYQANGVMLWAVIAPTSDLGRGALAGTYGGASASAALAVGLGANALIGGGEKSIALQPLSVEGIEGVNIAAGIGILTLRAR